jgi:hypothetical protein
MRVLFCDLLYVNALEMPPPPSHATDNSTFTFYFKYFLRILSGTPERCEGKGADFRERVLLN